MIYQDLTNKIIAAAIKVHKKLGPGLLESTYRECLCYELMSQGLLVEKEKPLPITYEGIKLDHGYRLDLLVERIIVIEIKTVETFTHVHFDQVLTYLKLGDFRVGLLINFYVGMLKDGLKRIVN